MTAMKEGNETVSVKRREYYCNQNGPWGLSNLNYIRIFFPIMHVFGFYGIYLHLTGHFPLSMAITSLIAWQVVCLGTNAGAHRLWTHRSYKAKLPLRIFYAFLQTAGGQFNLFRWVRDHRIHHKYVETESDPINPTRGMAFAHIGWIFYDEHPSIVEKEGTIDLSDVDNDPVVRFQNKYYGELVVLCGFIIPLTIQHFIWPQVPFFQLFCYNFVWMVLFNQSTMTVNSVAHRYGSRPYDRSLNSRENAFVSIVSGEGHHNFHHTFPWDFNSTEAGVSQLNIIGPFLRFMVWIGWAYDIKIVSQKLIDDRVARTGDPSYTSINAKNTLETGFEGYIAADPEREHPWGWGDENIP